MDIPIDIDSVPERVEAIGIMLRLIEAFRL